MGRDTSGRLRHLMCGAASAVLLVAAGAAQAQEARTFEIPAQPLVQALYKFGEQSGRQVLFKPALADDKVSSSVSNTQDQTLALAQLLEGTGLTFRKSGDVFLIEPAGASDPQSGGAAGDGADGTVQALIVTAQKREENIQDVPIAMSAFTQEDLTRSQVAGGPDLMTQVPNFTFTKTNFTGYSIQIRGIGTQAISATTDAAVAVAENNTPFIRNRFFEQEFYDLERVEVLRGPQGTLYGRNATAGVVNIISAKPKFRYEAKLSADVGNYNSSRLEGMINIPLVDDKVALRIAGAWTKRDGYDLNQITGNRIDGRDLWSTRVSLRFAPIERLKANLIWEHFEENDDRLRSGKQLCHTDEVTQIGGIPVTHYQTLTEAGISGQLFAGVQANFSQGCLPTSLYAPESFETPNGLSLPYYVPLKGVGLPAALDDPYISRTQSHDLRTIESTVDPQYKAKTDTVELQASYDLSDHLTLTSETGYNSDELFSTQDFNRFNTASGAFPEPSDVYNLRDGVLQQGPNGGVFCDPQIGCADRLVAVDLSTARSRQFSQEFRLSSDFEGPLNFSLGANFLRYDTEDKYYVFINTLSLIAAAEVNAALGGPYVAGQTTNDECLIRGMEPPQPTKAYDVTGCTYMDPNSISNLNDLGHNYFLSRNPYKLISYAAFGEVYYNITDNLKLTGGLRWTVDKKRAPRILSWVLASSTAGYPVAQVIKQEWREPTGRIAIDWKPHLSFTDETLLYASYARGYKAGGANPPSAGTVAYCAGCNADSAGAVNALSATHPKTFGPEFVNAFELGSKNTLLGGAMTLNLAAFYYDYTGYQISQIVDRAAINLNFDATVWGAELEADWRPLENLRFGLKAGYESTRVANGMKAVDLMDRTAGHSDWVVVRPFPTYTSNCILPLSLFLSSADPSGIVNVGGKGGGGPGGCEIAYAQGLDPVTDLPYVNLATTPLPPAPGNQILWTTLFAHPGYLGWNPATAPNNGEGFYKDLSGNELPNAPHITATLTTDYTVPLPNDWLMTLHGDFYYQSEAWTRIFNTPGYDKLKAYTNVNLAAIFANEDAGWKVMAYVKNVFDHDAITGAFLNSDDTGLTTNVFLNEPRLFGLRATKEFEGGPWWTGANPNHVGPYPFTVELGGEVQRNHGDYDPLAPAFEGALSDHLDAIPAVQNRRWDMGDAREVKVSWNPPGSAWSLASSLRYGRVNTATARMHQEEPGATGCVFGGKYTFLCHPNPYFYQTNFWYTTTNWSDSAARSHEDHLLVDFMVGRDFGLGASMTSKISAGLRYAEFNSRTELEAQSIPDWHLPQYGVVKYGGSLHRYSADLIQKRRFTGSGPALRWDAGKQLMSLDGGGQVDLDWSLSAGVLFGTQKASTSGSQTGVYHQGSLNTSMPPIVGQPVEMPLVPARSSYATSPLVDLSLGLSYDIQRVKVSAGYRWERYFNLLDVGYSEHKDADRTLDGPYFKIAVDFGG